MPENMDFPSYARHVRTLAKALLTDAHCASDIAGRMHLLTIAAEKDLLRFSESPEASRIVCGPGCGACCVVNVDVLIPEAITIAWYMQRWLSRRQLSETCDRLEEFQRETRWLDDEERLLLREPCVFLDEQGSCTIHVVRPLLCRSITSTNAQVCQDALAMDNLDSQPVVEMHLLQKRLMDTVFVQIGQALEDLGLDHRSYRLPSMVLALLVEPERVRDFLSGKKLTLH